MAFYDYHDWTPTVEVSFFGLQWPTFAILARDRTQ
jgi:hypothetical protein